MTSVRPVVYLAYCHNQANLQPGSLQNGARKAHGRRHLDPLDEVQFVIDKNAKVTVATFYLILINHKGTRIYRLTASEYIIFTEMSSYFTKMHKSSKPNQDGVHRKLQQFYHNIIAKRHNHKNDRDPGGILVSLGSAQQIGFCRALKSNQSIKLLCNVFIFLQVNRAI